MILAGDVGGTKTNLGLFSLEGGRLKKIFVKSFRSQEFPSLESMIREIPCETGRTVRVCLGVPGAIIDRTSKAVNLPWPIDAESIAKNLGIREVHLINDLEATAYGISELRTQDVLVLAVGQARREGTAALIAAGTGLGEAVLYWDGRKHLPIPSEAGQADFAPRNALEWRLLEHLSKRFGPVSWERVLSGPGLVNIYHFLKDTGVEAEQEAVAEAMREREPASVISEMALEGRCALCSRALDLFVSLYGAEAGNLALRAVAIGGVYLGGGIAPKIAERLAKGEFMQAFLAKDRMAPMLSSIPVYVILEEKTALLGAARYAALRAGAEPER